MTATTAVQVLLPLEETGRILLVDDEEIVLNVYGRVLRHAGFDVSVAADGRQACARLESMDVDVVVSDIDLPTMTGIELLRAVHRHDASLPVILMTGNASLSTAVQAVEYGALRYLVKPATPAVLIQAVVHAMALRRRANTTGRALEHYREVRERQVVHEDLERRFIRALETIDLLYQPIVRWSRHDVYAYEALLRSAEDTLAMPTALLAAAEALGRVHDVGRAVRRVASIAVGRVPAATDVFVNLHPQDLDDDDLYDSTSPLSAVAGRVVLEVTERASVGDLSDLAPRLAALRALGYRFAVDDLGAGYAGLTSLVHVHPEVVKLDMSLCRGVETDPTKQTLVRAMAALCGELGASVIAEGVESAGERDTVIGLGCDLLQGYLFGRPAGVFAAFDRQRMLDGIVPRTSGSHGRPDATSPITSTGVLSGPFGRSA